MIYIKGVLIALNPDICQILVLLIVLIRNCMPFHSNIFQLISYIFLCEFIVEQSLLTNTINNVSDVWLIFVIIKKKIDEQIKQGNIVKS